MGVDYTTEASGSDGVSSGDARYRRVERAVQDWVKQLIDLSGRNQLLYYRNLKRGTLELTGAVAVALDALRSGRAVRLTQLSPATAEHPEGLDDALRRARTLHSKALALFEERGIQTLYLAWGMATWTTDTSKSTPNAPVLLRPLRITPRGAAESDFDVALDGDWEINATLLHLLATEHALKVDDAALLETFDSEDARAPSAQDVFERLIKEAGDVPDFDIIDRTVAGTFSYTKLPMVQDLQRSIGPLASHDLIAALAGDPDARQAVRDQHAREFDPAIPDGTPDRTPPPDEFLIRDADASQNRAINAALAGEPLIIQGPPGTGKSQTIANLIATLTARGKRVLFVAEKRAAIDAVTKRLHDAGLDDLVMDLHGGVTSKKKLAADLAATLATNGRITNPDHRQLHRDVEEARQKLTHHVSAMHARREPWDVSLWTINEWLLALSDAAATDVRFTDAALIQLDADTAMEVRRKLREWADLSAPVRERRSPWAEAHITTPEQAREALDVVRQLATDTIPGARVQLERLLSETGLRPPTTVQGWSEVLDLIGGVRSTLESVSDGIWEADLEELADGLEPASRSWWSRTTAQLFSSRYRAAKRALRELWAAGKPNGPDVRAAALQAIDQLGRWQQLGGEGNPAVPSDMDGARGAHDHLLNGLAALGAFIATEDLTALSSDDVDRNVAAMARDEATALRLPHLHDLEQWLISRHCSPLLDSVRGGSLPAEAVADAFDHAWLWSLRTHVTASDPRLAGFDGQVHSKRAHAYAEADRRHVETTAERVRRMVAEYAVATRAAHSEQDGLISAQAKKKRGHLTLRQMFDQAPDVLTALRPCWAMSPLLVSQMLPGRQVFDVVVFDEASQITPADAIAALLRAPQAVVAGDDLQLPPTDFFGMVGADDDPDEEDEDGDVRLTTGYESVLDVLGVLLRQYWLTWHYRSADERLIAFSNHHIYEGMLTTFPGVAGDECLAHILIPHRVGVQVDTRSHDDEVLRVVDLMVDHARTRPDESLGVIAMGSHHADRIAETLRDQLQDEADADLDEFFDEGREERAFVKNLERVQGDERDAIILSMGYAKHPDGRMRYQFGPLNPEGGQRRLNVAVTRARRRMTVVSAFSHTDMDPGKCRSEGARLLRTYLKFAESGGDELEGAVEHGLNPFELSVKGRLESAGLRVIPQYGSSGFRIDFAVCHPEKPGRMVLAVEADGASYHSAPTARDRDRLRQQVLEDKGWRFHRIWSTDWFNDPERELVKVVSAYEAAVAQADEDEAPPSPAVSPKPSQTSNAPAEAARQGPRPALKPGQPISAYSHRQLVALAKWIRSDTRLRTPEEMLDEIMDELGFRRRGGRIVAALEAAIRDAVD